MSSEDEPLENLIAEATEVDYTSGSDYSEQQNLLTIQEQKVNAGNISVFALKTMEE